jgi:ADP-heptose:LPS heptosyltransferase
MSEPVFKPMAKASSPMPTKIGKALVILLGDLSEFVQALPAAKMIRDYHVGARITLLTTEQYRSFATACPWFDVVEIDPKSRDPQGVTQQIGRIRAGRFDAVYDLTGDARTNGYFLGLRPWPPKWSGVAPGCSHPHSAEDRDLMHPLDRLADQMHQAGLGPTEGFAPFSAPSADFSWVRAALRDPPRLKPEYFNVRTPFALLFPAAAEYGGWRWPPEQFVTLSKLLLERGVMPVVIGGPGEREPGAAIQKAVPQARVLISRADLFQVIALAQAAKAAFGFVGGPLHLAAAAGAPVVVLTGPDLPARELPRGANVVLSLTAADPTIAPAKDVARALGNVGAYSGAATGQ